MIIWNHTHLTMCRAKSTECQNWIKNQFDVFRFKAHFKNNRFGCEMGKIHNRKIGQQLVGFDCNSSKNIFPQSIIVFRLFSVFAFFCWNVIKIGCKRFHDWFFSISFFRFWHSVELNISSQPTILNKIRHLYEFIPHESWTANSSAMSQMSLCHN